MQSWDDERTRRQLIKTAGVVGSALALELGSAPRAQAAEEDEGRGVTRLLAEFVVDSKPEDVPQAPRAEAVRSVLNYVGCAVGGSPHETTDRAVAALSPFFGPEQGTLLGRRERADILHAALLNGMASHVLDFDDTQLSTIIHPAGPVLSAILPLAEMKGLDGRALLHAFVLGVEVECRVGKCVYPSHYAAGWHITGTAGVFGAAAAAGKLLGLNAQQMTWALGIAATQSSGFKEMFGTMCKSFHPGRAAQNGLAAALLAAQGFNSTEAAIEAKQGSAYVMATERDFGEITRRLGETWEISENAYKPFACGIVIHPIIDACRQLRNEHQLQADDIERVDLRVNPYVLSLTGKKTPQTGLEAKFSLYHSAAVAILFGAASPKQYTDDVAQDPAVIALRDRVRAEVDEAITEEQAEATITLKSGAKLHKRIEHAVGSSENPLSNVDLETKFRDLAAGVLPEAKITRLIDLCWKVESLNDVTELTNAAARSA
ncbi:MAG: MmgE/PrpD family protein [Acidobacteria bacterium]|nr:MmgE/PrpD family protein [Acidobacteriota bacterium]MDA1234385.1 MmgE/PrpD family protein [Acidobacteriota bacterium]